MRSSRDPPYFYYPGVTENYTGCFRQALFMRGIRKRLVLHLIHGIWIYQVYPEFPSHQPHAYSQGSALGEICMSACRVAITSRSTYMSRVPSIIKCAWSVSNCFNTLPFLLLHINLRQLIISFGLVWMWRSSFDKWLAHTSLDFYIVNRYCSVIMPLWLNPSIE